MFSDSGIRNIQRAVIHYRAALIIALPGEFFKIQSTIAQATILIGIEGIQRPAVEHVIVLFSLFRVEGLLKFNGNIFMIGD